MKYIEKRKVEIFTKGGWREINFEELKPGDKFRMFKPDGTPVEDSDGNRVFIAISEPFLTEDNVLAVEIFGGESSF